MDIKTKFDVHDLVQHKFQHSSPQGLAERDTTLYEVLDISTTTCYAGTQIFYHCRPIFRTYNTSYEKGKVEKILDISFGIVKEGEGGLVRLREDELRYPHPDLIAEVKSFEEK